MIHTLLSEKERKLFSAPFLFKILLEIELVDWQVCALLASVVDKANAALAFADVCHLTNTEQTQQHDD